MPVCKHQLCQMHIFVQDCMHARMGASAVEILTEYYSCNYSKVLLTLYRNLYFTSNRTKKYQSFISFAISNYQTS